MVGRGLLLWGSVIGTIVALPLCLPAVCVVFSAGGKSHETAAGFKHWFALVCWMLMACCWARWWRPFCWCSSDIRRSARASCTRCLSTSCVRIDRWAAPGYTWFEALCNISPGVLSSVLSIIGVKTWSQRSWGFASAGVVLLPVRRDLRRLGLLSRSGNDPE